jgi:hypothetical protein
MEVRLFIDDEFIAGLEKKLGKHRVAYYIIEGLCILDWAAEEVSEDRVIMSIGQNGEDPKRIETPGLRNARPR